jgi:hypothetical protein
MNLLIIDFCFSHNVKVNDWSDGKNTPFVLKLWLEMFLHRGARLNSCRIRIVFDLMWPKPYSAAHYLVNAFGNYNSENVYESKGCRKMAFVYKEW